MQLSPNLDQLDAVGTGAAASLSDGEAEGYRHPVPDGCGHQAAAALMRQAVQAISKDIDGRLCEHGLTLVQRRALMLLSERQAFTPGDLSLALDVDGGATSRLLDRLVAKGMCCRYRDSVDRRQVHLEITQAGQSALQVTQDTESTVLIELFSGVGGNELEVLSRVLSTVLAARR